MCHKFCYTDFLYLLYDQFRWSFWSLVLSFSFTSLSDLLPLYCPRFRLCMIMIKSAVQNLQVFQICLAATGARLFNTSPQFGIFEHFILSEFISISDKSWVPPISYKLLDASHVTKWTNLPGDLNGERICMWITITYVPCVLNYLIIEHVFIIHVYILKAVYKCSGNEF